MSRIGKKPIAIPDNVTISVIGDLITVKGPKGELLRSLHPDIKTEAKEGMFFLSPLRKTKKSDALWGLFRSLIANMVVGVTNGFVKKLEFEGVGYRASLEGNSLVMQLGFSHQVKFGAPDGIKLTVEKNTITISGIDKELVGNTASQIRRLQPPEPYKGKGIRYQGEVIRRKVGKKTVTAG